MAITPGNGRVGPAQVKRATTDIGGTFGAVEMTITANEVDIMMDQLGNTASDVARVGFAANVVVPIAEHLLDNYAIAFPGETILGTAPNRGIKMGGQVGQQAKRDGLTNVWELVPYSGGVPTTDLEEVVTLPAGYERANVSMSFTVDSQRVLAVTVEGLPDANGHRIILGNSAAA